MPMMGGPSSWADAVGDEGTVGEFADAVAYFRRVLRENWNGWKKGAPFVTYFHTSFQGGPREWARLYRLARALDDVPGLEALVRSDLGSSEWTEYSAAVMSLEICGRLRGSGCAVEFIETGGQAKAADARMRLAARWVTVEFKALHEPDAVKPWNEFTEWVLNELARRAVQVGGLEIDCEPPALRAREAFLEGVLEVQRSQVSVFQELPRGTGKARFAGGNMNRWTYPVADAPELLRLVGKLGGEWWKKFRGATTPTLLMVRTGMLFGDTARRVHEKAVAAVAVLREVLEDFETVGAVLIYDELMWQPPAPGFVATSEFRLSIGSIDGFARATLVVPNPRATLPLSEAELEVLVAPTMRW
jgi:hypothetical protein